jgi:hypothetical protein
MTNKNLAEHPVVLTPELGALPKAFTDTFYQELDSELHGFKNHLLISVHTFDKPWASAKCTPKAMRSSA